jgi:hypothetical protein
VTKPWNAPTDLAPIVTVDLKSCVLVWNHSSPESGFGEFMSKGKTRRQSFFISTTVQPFAFASSSALSTEESTPALRN